MDFNIILFIKKNVEFLKKYLLLVLFFFIKLRTHKISTIKFETHTLKFKNLKLRQFKHTILSRKLEKSVFVILYNHYLPKISKLKYQVPKLKSNGSLLLNPIREYGIIVSWINTLIINGIVSFIIQDKCMVQCTQF
jgi:hypothetical protein